MKNIIKTLIAALLIVISTNLSAQTQKTEAEFTTFIENNLIVGNKIQSAQFLQLLKDFNASLVNKGDVQTGTYYTSAQVDSIIAANVSGINGADSSRYNSTDHTIIVYSGTVIDTFNTDGTGTVATYGPELVLNGDFSTTDNWTLATGATIGGGVLSWDGSSGYNSTYQPNRLEIGKTYQVTFTIASYTSGSVRVAMGTGGTGIQRSSAGTFTENIVCSGNTHIYIQSYNTYFNGSVDNISVKEVL